MTERALEDFILTARAYACASLNRSSVTGSARRAFEKAYSRLVKAEAEADRKMDEAA